MGTNFSIKLVAPAAELDKEALRDDVIDMLTQINQQMSTYEADSELARFNASQATDWIDVSLPLCETVDAALQLSGRTNGAFDITVGPLVNLWGFGPGDTISEPPRDEEIAAARDRVGYHKLRADCRLPALKKDLANVHIDLSAYAKGYAVDRIAGLLDERQISDYLIEIGGELRMRGTNASGKHWAIAVEQPRDDARAVQTVLQLTDSAMATSGDYRNFFEFEGRRYSHAIDPGTGRPVTHDAAAVTVVRDTAAEADALATALLVLGPEEGLAFAEREGIAAYFLLRQGDGIDERMSSKFKELRQ